MTKHTERIHFLIYISYNFSLLEEQNGKVLVIMMSLISLTFGLETELNI